MTFVVVIILEGVWLAGLTYLMWRRHLRERQKKLQEDQKKQPDQPA